MYSLISRKGIYNEAVEEYIVDEYVDISDIPIDIPAGSKCFVISSSTTYMLNHQKQWVKITSNSGTSDDNSNIEWEDDV